MHRRRPESNCAIEVSRTDWDRYIFLEKINSKNVGMAQKGHKQEGMSW